MRAAALWLLICAAPVWAGLPERLSQLEGRIAAPDPAARENAIAVADRLGRLARPLWKDRKSVV